LYFVVVAPIAKSKLNVLGFEITIWLTLITYFQGCGSQNKILPTELVFCEGNV